MSDWQPIETAPKDGSPLLMWCPGGIEREMTPNGLANNTAIGFWLRDSWRSLDCADEGSMGSEYTGWMENWEWIEIHPTHWCEIPVPPATK